MATIKEDTISFYLVHGGRLWRPVLPTVFKRGDKVRIYAPAQQERIKVGEMGGDKFIEAWLMMHDSKEVQKFTGVLTIEEQRQIYQNQIDRYSRYFKEPFIQAFLA